MSVPESFRPKLDKSRLDDLRQRLARACDEAKSRPDPVATFESDKERFGITHSRYQHLLHAWQDFLSEDRKSVNGSRLGPDYDSWPALEKKLESFNHFQIDIEDIKLHYIHEKATPHTSSAQPVIPLLLLHGWPSSILDFLEVIKPLAHPGDAGTVAFDVVVPSQTGYLWSSSPTVDGSGRGKGSGPQGDFLLKDEARILHSMMISLGYRRYAIQAGDWGSALSRHMAAMYTSNVAALHLNFAPSPPPLLNPPLLQLALRLVPSKIQSTAYALTPTIIIAKGVQYIREYPRRLDRSTYIQEPTLWTILAHVLFGTPAPLSRLDREKVKKAITFITNGSAYATMQGTRPSTLGLVLQSDPGALLAWVGEKLLQWTDEDPSDADICALLTLYWCTDTMSRSIYNYRNRPQTGPESAGSDLKLYIRQPIGFSDFPKEIMPSPLSWIKETANVKWYRKHNSGGHFIAMEKPVEYTDDVRDCFSKIWPD